MVYSSETIEIPLQDSDEVIELDFNGSSIPDFEEVFDLLQKENAQLKYWIAVALEYYKQGQVNDFVSLMEYARSDTSGNYPDYDRDLLRALDFLVFHYIRQANKERNKDEKNKLLDRVYEFLNIGDKIALYNQNHLVGKAFLRILREDGMDQAEANLNLVLHQFPHHIPALLGKACLFFNRRDYKGALAYYKRILRHNPRSSPAVVRVAIGHCFLKLRRHDRAMDAFKRALELDPQCVGALVGVAISKINRHEIDDIRAGVNILSNVCSLDSNNPVALNHLANHFFFKKDYKKSNELAWRAFTNTENEAIRAESCYQLARTYHVQGNYNQAFQYYYRATQSASPNFVFPQYGLGQMYIQRNDIENAAQCFERVLKVQSTNYETMKILGSLYANSTSQSKREIAKNYLKRVTEMNPDDFESWIELAQILEQSDLHGSLKAYDAGCKIIRDIHQTEVPPEILNNMSVLKYRLNKLEDSREEFSEALALCKNKVEQDPSYYNSIAITITYNLGRVNEALCRSDLAETLYKDILKEHPNYVDCYLRLGCMARNKNRLYDASEWFKEALRVDAEHPDVWSLLGNLHLSKCEWGPAQNKFDRILKNPQNRQDSYSLVALGNIWLHTLYTHAYTTDENRKYVLQERALSQYVRVLKNDPQNIWAANGIGCVLAHKRCFNEARDVFAQVREATSDFCDVWLNIAHIYLEQKQYLSAIQMYENCMKKFFKHHNVTILKYLGKAYYQNGRFKEAKTIFLKAQRVAPHDITILFNIALVLKRLASQIFQDEKSNLEDVLQAKHELGLSQRYFKYLSINGDGTLYDPRLAELEAKRCQDLESQAKYQVARAQKIDKEEKQLRKKQEKEIVNIRLRQLEEQLKAEESQRREKEDMQQRRQEYIEKTKGALIFEIPIKEKQSKSKGRGRDLMDADSGESAHGSPSESKSTRKKKSKTKSVCNTKKRGREQRDGENSERRSSADSDRPKPKRGRKAKVKEAKTTTNDRLSAKQKMRIVSKAIVSSSSASSSDSDGGKLIIACQRSRSVSRSRSRSGSRSRSSSRSHSRCSFARSTSRSRSPSPHCASRSPSSSRCDQGHGQD